MELVNEKIIRCLAKQAVLLKTLFRKVLDIIRNDCSRLSHNGSCQDMPVIFVGAIEAVQLLW